MKDIDTFNLNRLLRDFKEKYPNLDYFTLDEIVQYMDMAFCLGVDEGLSMFTHSKKVRREDGKIYDSLTQAAEQNRTHKRNISKAIINKYKCAGYSWELI